MGMCMISDKRVREIDKVTQGFGFGLVQDAVTLLDLASHHSITVEELRKYVYFKKDQSVRELEREESESLGRQKRENKLWESVAPKCPDCGDILVRPKKLCGKNIPTNQRGYSCHWFCIKGWDKDEPDDICGWEKYTKEKAVEVTRDLMEGKLDGYNIP